ncbi:putative RNA 3'-terminal phosphate cyclase-like protein [Habropoda laboriosa]|uniref:Putative RNA 3'-terminal phosphate cyclase-like protein n=1 Tax=Habropoda laboriosa TaxID=597456 RepID=A0A0L7RGH6_9HYME|nr:PREDICTED: probable RNA 3'-terminal phosphate cyclase-like protein [Habropoda laboriosa]KOC69913.1 putative RNA 3'-terminal phosphate cyclase-like protein [Habropoda laboriosa]
MPAIIKNNVLIYEGCNYLRYRLILSTLSGKPVRITNIRIKDDDPGLKEYEVSFIRLLDKITNGTRIELNETGTNLFYGPGLLNGGELEHDCSLQRGIGYYLEAIVILAPFCKNAVDVKLKGITNNTMDPSVDRIKVAAVPILKRFLLGDNEILFTISKRGAAPLGGGEIRFKCPVSRNLKSIHFQNSGMVKRVRGTACSIRVSPAIANRIVESAKGVLLKFLPDVYIHTDHCKGAASGKSPGFGVTLSAETTTDVVFGAEAFSPLMKAGSLPCVPEDIGKEAAMKLVDEIYRNGCVDSPFQSMTAMFMALGKKDVSKIVTGPLTPSMIQFLRDLRDFFGVVFKIEKLREDDEILDQVVLTCIGVGYSNRGKRTL